jgi:integrase
MGQDPVAAKTRCADRVAYWLHVFARLQAGESLERSKRAEDTAARLAPEFDRIRREYRQAFRPLSDEELEAEIAKKRNEDRQRVASEVNSLLKGTSVAPGTPEWNAVADRVVKAIDDAHTDAIAEEIEAERRAGTSIALWPPTSEPAPETISQAAEALFSALERDGLKQLTVYDHRQRIAKFIERCGDLPLASVTRAMASDFLDWIGEGRSNATRNNYAGSMAQVFACARKRGRFSGDNPFAEQKIEAESEGLPFDAKELQAILTSLPREIKPATHSPESALPWITLIATFTGARLEEISQLTVADIREQQANGGTITCLGIHDEGDNSLKNKASKRLVPVHSTLVRAGLLDYLKALPQDGLAFPGLKRRASKGGKFGVRVGELFRKRLIALGIKREGKNFRSFRHSVAENLEAHSVSQTDAARVLGHKIDGMSYGVYSSGPGLKRLAAIVEEIKYDGLRV